jgi:hypothetical protein
MHIIGASNLTYVKSRARAYRREHVVGPELQAWREKTKETVGKAFARDRKPYEEYREEMGRLVSDWYFWQYALQLILPASGENQRAQQDPPMLAVAYNDFAVCGACAAFHSGNS